MTTLLMALHVAAHAEVLATSIVLALVGLLASMRISVNLQ